MNIFTASEGTSVDFVPTEEEDGEKRGEQVKTIKCFAFFLFDFGAKQDIECFKAVWIKDKKYSDIEIPFSRYVEHSDGDSF